MTEPRFDEPLAGRVAVVTGVSRRQGIAYAVASRLLVMGADLFVSHHRAHDCDQPWGADDVDVLLDDLRGAHPQRRLIDLGLDLAEPAAPQRLIDSAVEAYGHLDILVCVHARSGGDGSIFEMTPERLDGHWAVNTRSTLLLTRYFADQHRGRPRPADDDGVRDSGRVIWFTSGQGAGPMRDEVAYATSKAGLAGVAATVADELLDRRILLNVVNPGPVDTGYLSPEGGLFTEAQIAPILERMPLGRFGSPDDPARLVAWLVSDEGRWVVGQVISSEGGFRRFT